MMLSREQLNIVNAPLASVSVIACAGSGKTVTAVHRLAKIRSDLRACRTWVALLSFSNIAVDTFNANYDKLLIGDVFSYQDRIAIETFDSFITNNILRPHAYRLMGCKTTPFLITGNEGFLQNKQNQYWYSVAGRNIPVSPSEINKISISLENNDFVFKYNSKNQYVMINNGLEITNRLGVIGAYTHELGRYWAIKILQEQPALARVISNRFAHIIVDEAQDIGVLHQKLLELLMSHGTQISLIGDPCQAIYEFAGANGLFMKKHQEELDASLQLSLSTNYRSIPEIMNIANSISKNTNVADREANTSIRALFTQYDDKNPIQIVDVYKNILDQLKISPNNAAVLCRSQSLVNKLKFENLTVGHGNVKLLVLAAIKRDLYVDYSTSFRLVTRCIVGLLKNPPNNLTNMILNAGRFPIMRELRRDIWMFVRNSDSGLPSAQLSAKNEWIDLVRIRVKVILDKFQMIYGYESRPNLNSVLSKKFLTDQALINVENQMPNQELRIDTVHQAKGESLDGVLYVANKEHIEKMLDGVGTETGRIGYVALTRARDLFVLGVPKSYIKTVRPRLINLGLVEL